MFVRAHLSGLPAIAATLLAAGLAASPGTASTITAQTDLDAFMQKVLARRDENWKRLQQYILDERQEIQVRGISNTPLWGERRDFSWFIRDGYFVRSPVKVGRGTGDGYSAVPGARCQVLGSRNRRSRLLFVWKTSERSEHQEPGTWDVALGTDAWSC